jgi:hypothetical protein
VVGACTPLITRCCCCRRGVQQPILEPENPQALRFRPRGPIVPSFHEPPQAVTHKADATAAQWAALTERLRVSRRALSRKTLCLGFLVEPWSSSRAQSGALTQPRDADAIRLSLRPHDTPDVAGEHILPLAHLRYHTLARSVAGTGYLGRNSQVQWMRNLRRKLEAGPRFPWRRSTRRPGLNQNEHRKASCLAPRSRVPSEMHLIVEACPVSPQRPGYLGRNSQVQWMRTLQRKLNHPPGESVEWPYAPPSG